MKFVLIISLLFFSNLCGAQSDSVTYCKEKITIVYHSSLQKVKKETAISLEDGFNNQMSLYVNNKLIIDRWFKTDGSLGVAYFFSLKGKNKVLKFEEKGNICFEFYLDNRYEFVRIFRKKNGWLVIYSNESIEYE